MDYGAVGLLGYEEIRHVKGGLQVFLEGFGVVVVHVIETMLVLLVDG
jgi:hypothetical protein